LIKLIVILLLYTTAAFSQIAVKGDTIYTMDGEPLINGIILINNNKIEKVGKASEISIPSGYTLIEGKIITPGLIDAHSVVGLAGIYNYAHDQDQLEKSDAIQPELRAFDAYNLREELIGWIRQFGTTTLHTGHGPGALASGQTMIVKTAGESLEEVIIDSVSMIAFTLGPSVTSNYQRPGTRSKGVAMLRSQFLKAQEYLIKQNSKEKPARDLKLEALSEVLNGNIPALFTVNKANDILSAIRLSKEFNFKLILDGAAEASLVIDEIKKADIPVIVHPIMGRNYGEMKSASLETASLLYKNGIKTAMQSGYEGYVPKTRVVLFEAAMAHAYGLPFNDALASLTINAAELLGISQRLGSITPGKDADIVIFDGNPFEYTTHVCKVIINGKVVNEECQ
jgi:imidazolonepropionase-like amidohydrolase